MSSIYRRNGVWQIQWVQDGAKHRRILGTRDEEQAKKDQQDLDNWLA